MRIIAGQAKGRRIAVPAGNRVRPTTDRVREALFSRLAKAVDEARVLDLFAGSGALGLEALSRGAKHVVFVERARPVQQVLKQNIETLGMTPYCRVLPYDAERALKLLNQEGKPFELIFLDPPYIGPLLERVLELLVDSQLLSPASVVVAEHLDNHSPTIPKRLRTISRKSYGDTVLTILKLKEDDESTSQGEESDGKNSTLPGLI